jgi:VIT1/CCC1 family predicted Fe2+/Mn2+ transporter
MIGVMGSRPARHFHYRKDLVLRFVQPALAGFTDGSVSTLAPIFATIFATHQTHAVLLIGLASALGAGISMGFSEGLSDDGKLTGRGHPATRATIIGLATFVGGVLHTLPFLLPTVQSALPVACAVVGFELVAIAFVRHRFLNASFGMSVAQVVGGGALVFVAASLIGAS